MNKKIISLVLALAMLLSLSLCLFSCGDKNKGNNENENNNQQTENKDYTVSVVDSNGNPVSGVKLSFTTPGGIPFPGTTGADGKATLNHNEDGVTVKVTSIPRGYEYNKLNADQSFDANRNLVITITALEPIVINVVDNEGAPIASVLVQMCDTSGSCRMPTATNEEGKAFYVFEEGEFKAQLTNGAPDGYTVDDPTAYYPIVDGEVTIVLTKIAD